MNNEILLSKAKFAIKFLGGNPNTIDTCEKARKALFEYGRVKFLTTKNLMLETILDSIPDSDTVYKEPVFVQEPKAEPKVEPIVEQEPENDFIVEQEPVVEEQPVEEKVETKSKRKKK